MISKGFESDEEEKLFISCSYTSENLLIWSVKKFTKKTVHYCTEKTIPRKYLKHMQSVLKRYG